MKAQFYFLPVLLLVASPIHQGMAVHASNPIVPVKVAVASFAQLSNLNDFIRDDHQVGTPTFPFINAQGAVMTNSTGQTSSLFTKTQMAKANPTSPGFSTYFVMDIYKTNSGVPADGYVFTLANNTSTLGSTGGGLGYQNVPQSVGIIFDYFQNNNLEIVASTDVFTNGSLTSRTGSAFDNSFLSLWSNTPLNQKVRSMHTWIEYNTNTSSIEIRVSPDNATRPTNATRLQTNLTLNQISEFYYAGFSAATGGSSMGTVLNRWYFASEFIQGGINLNANTYAVDNTPPTAPTISTSLNNNQYSLTVSGGTDDNAISGYQVKKPGGNWITYQTPILMDTVGVYEARSVDTVGNFSTSLSTIGLWRIQFLGYATVLKTMDVLSDSVYTISELLSDSTYRYSTWFYNNERIQEIAYPTQSIQLYGEGVRYVYHLQFNLQGGTPSSPLPLTYTLGSVWGNPQLTLEGHTFEGWFLDGAYTIPFEESLIDLSQATIELFAKFTPIQLLIYLYDGVSNLPWVEINTYYGSLIAPLIVNHVPSREGYTFIGWTLDEQGQLELISETTLSTATSLYAQWTINAYTLSFDVNGGSTIMPLTLDFQSLLNLSSPTKEGFTFQGWYMDEALSIVFNLTTMPAESLTLYAKWTVNQYTITFITSGGTLIPSITEDFGSTLITPSSPIREGYTFEGWYRDEPLTTKVDFPSTMPAYDLTLYAKWIINTHTVRFYDHESELIQTTELNYGLTITSIPTLIRPGYRFLGWSLNAQPVDFSTFTMPDQSVTFTPLFEGISVELKFYTGHTILSIEATSGQAIGALPTLPVNPNYDFLGWSLAPLDETQLINETYIVPNVETLRLFPVWIENHSPIQTLKPNDGMIMAHTDVTAWMVIISLIGIVFVYTFKALKEEYNHAD